MTTRTQFDRQMRWVSSLIYAGFGLFVIGLVIGEALGQGPILAVYLPGFVIAFVTMLCAYSVGFRCPKCRCNLGVLVLQRGGFRVDKRLRFCPYCGTGLDDELPGSSTIKNEAEPIVTP
jgi:hypothetical protein